MEGLIVKSTGSWYHVRTNTGQIVRCRLPGKFRLHEEKLTNPVVVGDRITVSMQSDDTGTIEKIHERKNELPRKATHGKKGVQIIASNIEQVVIVQSCKKPEFKTGFIDRILVSCEAYDISPLIILNKSDLVKNDKEVEKVTNAQKRYQNLGYQLQLTSYHDPETIQLLEKKLDGKVSVMTGPSGTGKSTLLNSIRPQLQLKTNEISRSSNKGKHTTTLAELFEIKEDTFVIDTPGIREFGLVNIESYELALFFPEMRQYRNQCHYYNCTHRHEPDCAVKKALEEEHISQPRYKSYLNILESIEQNS